MSNNFLLKCGVTGCDAFSEELFCPLHRNGLDKATSPELPNSPTYFPCGPSGAPGFDTSFWGFMGYVLLTFLLVLALSYGFGISENLRFFMCVFFVVSVSVVYFILQDSLTPRMTRWSRSCPVVFCGAVGAAAAILLLIFSLAMPSTSKQYCSPGTQVRILKAKVIIGAKPSRAKIEGVDAPEWITTQGIFTHNRDIRGRQGDDACDYQGTLAVSLEAPRGKSAVVTFHYSFDRLGAETIDFDKVGRGVNEAIHTSSDNKPQSGLFEVLVVADVPPTTLQDPSLKSWIIWPAIGALGGALVGYWRRRHTKQPSKRP